jgi:hypothetical protein
MTVALFFQHGGGGGGLAKVVLGGIVSIIVAYIGYKAAKATGKPPDPPAR